MKYLISVAVLGVCFLGIVSVHAQGPDGFGYAYSASPGLFNWIDISSSGTEIEIAPDSSSGLFPIGFDFEFYGISYDEINVGAGGHVFFNTNTVIGGENACIPGSYNYGAGD